MARRNWFCFVYEKRNYDHVHTSSSWQMTLSDFKAAFFFFNLIFVDSQLQIIWEWNKQAFLCRFNELPFLNVF